MPKKSYMNKNNLLKEGFFDSIVKLIQHGKLTFLSSKLEKLEKKYNQDHSELKNVIKTLNNDYDKLSDIMYKNYGIRKPDASNLDVDSFIKKQDKNG